MNRKISWESCELDEIELVYEKGEANADIGLMLEELEEQALSEVKNYCLMSAEDKDAGRVRKDFDDLSEPEKEYLIKVLAGAGLRSISQDFAKGIIFIRLSSRIQSVMACTFFDILNRLEKLDGAITMLRPEWTLELQVPLGGKKGLFRKEMLIVRLYPWISVKETATNELAESMPVPDIRFHDRPAGSDSAKRPNAEKQAEAEGKPPADPPENAREEKNASSAKPSFWKKIFGK